MWFTVHYAKVNFFTIVVQQLGGDGNSQIYRIYARRLGLGVYCPIFRFGTQNRATIYGDWQTAFQDFSAFLMKFNAPLGIKTDRDIWDKFKKIDDTTYYK